MSDAVDNHRSFNDKHGFTGKREIQPDEDIKAGNEILNASIVDLTLVFYVVITYCHWVNLLPIYKVTLALYQKSH